MNGHDTIPISQLPAASSLEGTELLAVVQAGDTRKATVFSVLAPAISRFSGATLYGVNISVPSGGIASAIQFDSALDDTDGYIQGGNLTQFVAPFTGWYLLTVAITWDPSTTGYREVDLVADFGFVAGDKTEVSPTPTGGWVQNVTARTSLTDAGSTFSVQPYQTSGGDLQINAVFTITYLGGAGSSPPPPPTILLQDDFIDTTGTNLTVHVPEVGPGWVEYGLLTHAIDSDSARLTTALNVSPELHYVAMLAPSADGVLSCRIGPNSWGSHHQGLVFRGSDSANFQAVGSISGFLEWYAFVAGVPGLLGSVTITYNTAFDLAVSMNGPILVVSVNGVPRMAVVTSVHETELLMGLWGLRDTGFVWDNFLMVPLD